MTVRLHHPPRSGHRRTGCFDVSIACCLAGIVNVTGLALVAVIALV